MLKRIASRVILLSFLLGLFVEGFFGFLMFQGARGPWTWFAGVFALGLLGVMGLTAANSINALDRDTHPLRTRAAHLGVLVFVGAAGHGRHRTQLEQRAETAGARDGVSGPQGTLEGTRPETRSATSKVTDITGQALGNVAGEAAVRARRGVLSSTVTSASAVAVLLLAAVACEPRRRGMTYFTPSGRQIELDSCSVEIDPDAKDQLVWFIGYVTKTTDAPAERAEATSIVESLGPRAKAAGVAEIAVRIERVYWHVFWWGNRPYLSRGSSSAFHAHQCDDGLWARECRAGSNPDAVARLGKGTGDDPHRVLCGKWDAWQRATYVP